MKLSMLIFSLIFFFLPTVKSQDTASNPRVFNAIIKQNHLSTMKGYLANISDSAVYITQVRTPANFATIHNEYFQKIDYKSIVSIKVYNKRSRALTFLISTLAGAGIGALIGYAGGDDTAGWFAATAGEKAFLGAIIGAGAGAVIATVITQSQVKKFLINGDWKSLQEMKEGLQQEK